MNNEKGTIYPKSSACNTLYNGSCYASTGGGEIIWRILIRRRDCCPRVDFAILKRIAVI